MANDFKAFAIGVGANVISQAAYDALVATLVANGFSAGVASSAELNKVWRQSSVMAAVLAQFINDVSGQDVLDNGNTATILTNLKASIPSAVAVQSSTSRWINAVAGTNAITGTVTPALTVYTAGNQFNFVPANANTGPVTIAINGLAAIPITKNGSTALEAGDIVAGVTYTLTYDGTRFQVSGFYGARRTADVRQTVSTGPVDANGLPNFGGVTGGTTVTMSGTLTLTASNGGDAFGDVDRFGAITNASWTGLNTNGTRYLTLTVNADGTCTTNVRTLIPNYRWGGADVVTNGQLTFNIQQMQMKLGNGATASPVFEVAVGEVVVSGSVVTSITWYALKGRYYTVDTGVPSNTRINKNHNIGVIPRQAYVAITPTASTQGYNIGEEIPIFCVVGSGGIAPSTPAFDRLGMGVVANTGSWFVQDRATGTLTAANTANWDTVFYANRGW